MKAILVENEIVCLENVQYVRHNVSEDSITVAYFGTHRDSPNNSLSVSYCSGTILHCIHFSGKDKKENSQKAFDEIFKILSK